ncbi:MAG: YidC/Oxa1 family membrane protein insertase [Clostridiales bacterium]|nr:YidC/Oxa1 family membrane protein insertase [Clostridiales bacterium]
MFTQLSLQLLRGMVQKDPGTITGTIANILGVVMNWIYNGIYFIFGEGNSLGLAIIIFTIFVRLLMTPLAYKQQKSSFLMKKIQPEINKLQEKYPNAQTDPEVQKKLAAETQKVYAKYNFNPFSGCLPLLIQLPIFFALYYIMQNAFLYIDHIQDVYTQISNIIINNADQAFLDNTLIPIALTKVPESLYNSFDVTVVGDLCKLLNKISVDQWKEIAAALPNAAAQLEPLYESQTAIETFLGLRVTEITGFDFTSIKIIIPLLSGFTTWLSSYLMTKMNSVSNSSMQQQQMIMNIIMPLMMAYITVQLPVGVGIYWIVGNVFMIVQQYCLNKYFSSREKKESEAAEAKKPEIKSKNSKNNKGGKK